MAASWRTELIRRTKKKANSCVQDVEQVFKHFQGLRPGSENFTYNNGIQKQLLTLEGTIPIKVRGVTYNIPVCVLLQENHPEIPPLAYVRPTSSMAIKESEYVDSNGRIYHPYLHKWNYKTCNIASFLRILCDLFGKSPPVYSKPQETTSHSQPQQQQPPSSDRPRSSQQQPPPSSDRPRSSQQQPPPSSDRPRSSQQQPPPSSDRPRSSQQQPTPTSNPQKPAQPQEQQKECIICMDNPRNSVLIPCGHLGVCITCARQLQQTTKICPVCRQNITQFHQVFDT